MELDMEGNDIYVLIIGGIIIYLLYMYYKQQQNKNKGNVANVVQPDRLLSNRTKKVKNNKDTLDMEVKLSDFNFNRCGKKNQKCYPYRIDRLVQAEDIDFVNNDQYHSDWIETLAIINMWYRDPIFNIANRPVIKNSAAE